MIIPMVLLDISASPSTLSVEESSWLSSSQLEKWIKRREAWIKNRIIHLDFVVFIVVMDARSEERTGGDITQRTGDPRLTRAPSGWLHYEALKETCDIVRKHLMFLSFSLQSFLSFPWNRSTRAIKQAKRRAIDSL